MGCAPHPSPPCICVQGPARGGGQLWARAGVGEGYGKGGTDPIPQAGGELQVRGHALLFQQTSLTEQNQDGGPCVTVHPAGRFTHLLWVGDWGHDQFTEETAFPTPAWGTAVLLAQWLAGLSYL